LRVGDSATARRRLTRFEVEALALVAGDADALQIASTERAEGDEMQVESVGAEAFISGLLNRRLPGPGTSIAAHNLQFTGHLQAGDEIVATVTVREKQTPGRLVVFDCAVSSNGREVISGTATVRAPEEHLHYADVPTPEIILRRTDEFAKVLRACENLPAVVCAVVHPCDRESLLGALEAAKRGLIMPVLIGPEARMRAVANAADIDLSGYRTIFVAHSHAAADKAVALARAGEVQALMKGSLHTDELIAAVIASETGLRTARRISHVFVLDVPAYPRPLLVTDAAINIAPTLRDKVDIVQNAIELARVLRIATPKVAILSAIETVNPDIPSTLDAAALCKMADRGQITGGMLDGPLAFDNAVSEEAARTKNIDSPVAGRADILLVPDLEAGNMLAKQLTYLAGADSAGIVLGARVPIVLTSRADHVRSRLASTALMVLVAHEQQQKLAAAIST
jgi:phosphate acetyltransferase